MFWDIFLGVGIYFLSLYIATSFILFCSLEEKGGILCQPGFKPIFLSLVMLVYFALLCTYIISIIETEERLYLFLGSFAFNLFVLLFIVVKFENIIFRFFPIKEFYPIHSR